MIAPSTFFSFRHALVAALGALAVGTCTHAADHPHWDYGAAAGPAQWAQLSEEYATCAVGHEQSPIDIRETRKADLPVLEFDYHAAPLRAVDNGHTIQFDVAPGSELRIGDDRYRLVQFHFHRPSEERIGGRPFAMVAHLVHRNAAGRLAVVGVLIESGGTNALLETLWSHLPQKSGHRVELPEVAVDATRLLPAERGYYTFAGSLTTPPCSEGVRWFVLKRPNTASDRQIETFARRYPNNARPVQPRNARIVQETSSN